MLFESNEDIAHLLDPRVIDGLRPKNGEAPKIEAYTHLNILYKDCYLQKYGELKDLPNEERVAAAKSFVQNPENLKDFIENRVVEWRAEQEKLSDAKPWHQAAPEWLWNARNKLQNNSNIPVDLPERLAREAEAALAELPKYEKDFEAYFKAGEQPEIAVAANKLPVPQQGAAQRN